MPSFSKTSKKRLSECHPDIIEICEIAIEIADFTIITGHRTKEQQNALYPKYTKLKWPNGKHNKLPSLAVDIAPYIKPFGVIIGSNQNIRDIMEQTGATKREVNDFIIKSYARVIGIMQAIAYVKNIDIRVGLDWDGDFNLLDQNFDDLGHIELIL